MAAERNGPVRAVPIVNDSIDQIRPATEMWIDPGANLMTDGHLLYRKIGQQHASHLTISHSQKEYVRDSVHINTAESFGALIERAKQGNLPLFESEPFAPIFT
ncbi:transposase [Thermodesulfobacteriota bacterium]